MFFMNITKYMYQNYRYVTALLIVLSLFQYVFNCISDNSSRQFCSNVRGIVSKICEAAPNVQVEHRAFFEEALNYVLSLVEKGQL